MKNTKLFSYIRSNRFTLLNLYFRYKECKYDIDYKFFINSNSLLLLS